MQLQVLQLQLCMQRAWDQPAHQQPLPTGAQEPLQGLLRIDTIFEQYFEAVAACRSVSARPGSAIGLPAPYLLGVPAAAATGKLFVHSVTSTWSVDAEHAAKHAMRAKAARKAGRSMLKVGGLFLRWLCK